MDLNIVQGYTSDLDEIERLYNEVNDSLESINYAGWKKGAYPTRADAKKGIEEQNLFIVKQGGKIIGSIILNHKQEEGYNTIAWLSDAKESEVFVIHTLAVHPAYKRNGIGKHLLLFAENYARQCNMKSIRLDVYENNIPAIKLYENCGYQYLQTIDIGLSCYGLDWFKIYEKVL
jgi:ribosomal protein S18 acetylase RimI-like enzyme|nr:GNAT family N-acetyltransferase [uncultured Lachnoclostridium sp.]